MKEVIVWTLSWNDATKVLQIGLAVGGAGCSPFCGCAAVQLAEQIQNLIVKEFPEVKKVIGRAALPSDEIVKKWNDA